MTSYVPTALIVDDDENVRRSLEVLVKREGFATRSAASLAEARLRLTEGRPDVVLMDLKLPDGDGLEWLRSVGDGAAAEVIVITGAASIDSAVNAMRDGALDYLTKPIDAARLTTALLNVARTRALKEEVGTLRSDLRDLGRFGGMVGRSKAMLDLYDVIARVGPTEATVFITGESGSGKELVAETVHRTSPRSRGPLLPVNCGAVSPHLIESELFGHERGSFTGADRQRKGYFERANGGTLFLDEVCEMPQDLQVKLLRVLETSTLSRIGGSLSIRVDVRIVAATNRNPEEAVRSGHLRQDLYYRLNVFPIAVPPLRSRVEDIEPLAEHFLAELNRAAGTSKHWLPSALARLRESSWPGNVRELKNAVQRAFILGDGEIGPDALPAVEPGAFLSTASPILQLRVGGSIAAAERRVILATIEMENGNKRKAAAVLGISLKTLYNRLSVYSASPEAPSTLLD
jgi:two-component system, NtrC family, response regulator HydG